MRIVDGESQVGVVFEQVSNGRIAAKCVPEGTPVTVSCRDHRNKTVGRDRPQSTLRLQLLEQLAPLQKTGKIGGGSGGNLAGEASNEGLVSESSGEI